VWADPPAPPASGSGGWQSCVLNWGPGLGSTGPETPSPTELFGGVPAMASPTFPPSWPNARSAAWPQQATPCPLPRAAWGSAYALGWISLADVTGGRGSSGGQFGIAGPGAGGAEQPRSRFRSAFAWAHPARLGPSHSIWPQAGAAELAQGLRQADCPPATPGAVGLGQARAVRAAEGSHPSLNCGAGRTPLAPKPPGVRSVPDQPQPGQRRWPIRAHSHEVPFASLRSGDSGRRQFVGQARCARV